MNNTKWRELINVLYSHPDFEPEVRIKYIIDEAVPARFSLIYWEEEGDLKDIEWLEIDPVKREYSGRLLKPKETSYFDYLKQELDKFSIPYTVENNVFRIFGYLRVR